MDPNHEIENFHQLSDEIDSGETASVEDFIKELEAKEKDLHITADTSIIEISESFDDHDDMPEFMREAMAANGNKVVLQPAAPQPSTEDGEKRELESTVEKLREQVEKMEADRDEQFKNSQRRARDFETYKTRTERERTETFQMQMCSLAKQMLPAFDNLNRALDFAAPTAETKDAEFRQFFEGIELVNQQMNDVFERMGVTQIIALGQAFDPHLHEAVATEVNNELPPNTIAEEMLRGYRIGEKVIRHSMVKVSQRSADEPAPAEIAPPDDDTGHENPAESSD